MLGGRGVAALGAGGFAGYMMMRSLGQLGTAAGSYMQAGVGEAGGMVSGSPFGAASAMIQAEAQRSIAIRQGIGGTFGAIGSGMSGIGGIGLASGSAAMSGPVGWGMLAGGAILSIASQFGTSAATAAVGKLTAVEQAAVSRAESVMGRRGALAQSITGALPFGAVADLDELRQMGDRYGFAANDLQGMNLAYRRAGGRGLGVEHLAQARLGWQLSPETLGQYERPFLPGGGATRGGDAAKDLQAAMAAGIAAGIDATRMPEYLARTSSLLASAADQGLNIRSESVQQLVADLGAANPALQGMSRLRAAESTIQTGRQLSGTLTNTMAPRELVEGLLLRDVIGQGGGPLDWSRRLNDPERFGQAASRVVTGSPDILRPFIASQITGLVPDQANLSGWRAGGGRLPSGEGVLADAARRVTEDPEFAFQREQARTANIEALTLTLQELKPILESMRDFMRVGVDNAGRQAAGSINRARRDLGGGGDIGGGTTPVHPMRPDGGTPRFVNTWRRN